MRNDLAGPLISKLARKPLLTEQQEIDLVRRRDAGDRTAVDEFVMHNQRIILKIAKRYHWSDIDLNDLVQAGQIGLLTAAERYDLKHGSRFGSFATWWVRHAIGTEVLNMRHTIRIPVFAQNDWNTLSHHPLQCDEAATEMGWGKARKESALLAGYSASRKAFSIDKPIDDSGDTIHPAYDHSHEHEAVMTREIVDTVLGRMTGPVNSRFADMLRLYYGIDCDPHSLTMLSGIYRISRERVRQLLNKARENAQQIYGRLQVSQV